MFSRRYPMEYSAAVAPTNAMISDDQYRESAQRVGVEPAAEPLEMAMGHHLRRRGHGQPAYEDGVAHGQQLEPGAARRDEAEQGGDEREQDKRGEQHGITPSGGAAQRYRPTRSGAG
jgi:hypothetical protein